MSAYATCITAYEPNRLMSTGFVPSSVSTVCVTRQPWGSSEVEAFLSWLANERKVSVSTHRQALAALLFVPPNANHHYTRWLDLATLPPVA